jgi:hypothetical protein
MTDGPIIKKEDILCTLKNNAVLYNWNQNSIFAKDSHWIKKLDNENLIMYYCEKEEEAVVIAALFIRHFALNLSSTYYDTEDKIIYIDMVSRTWALSKPMQTVLLEELTNFILMNKYILPVLIHDMHGKQLFITYFNYQNEVEG